MTAVTMTSRREFLASFARSAGCFIATASLAPLAGCSGPRGAAGNFGFPQGVASADPQPDAIVLWTRVVPEGEDAAAVELRVQLATDPAFSAVLLEEDIVAERDFDFTVRCFVDGLEPDRHYHYRFVAPDGSLSRQGRTRTAPADDAERALNAAVCSCQHYEDGLFSAYRRLLIEDEQAPADRKLDVIIFVGDFIYEASNRRAVVNLDRQVVELQNADGSPRRIPALPSKGPAQELGVHLIAETLDDYRELYKIYLTDPDLQDARAAFPFISTWDDHEFYNDAWQSFHPSGPAQRRKVASNQAWFEYIPAALSAAPAGSAVVNPARDFSPTEVTDVALSDFDENYLSREPNNLAAIASLSIYRSLRWGRWAELLLVDGRSYRGPRGVDQAIPGADFITPVPVSVELVETQNAGRTANGGNPPETVTYDGVEFANSRRESPVGSLLGAEQKAWFKDSLRNSDAQWKVLCNNVPMMRFGFDMTFRVNGGHNDLWWTDTWDGYPVERRELTTFIAEQGLTNVVSLTGDRHAHFAGVVYDDYDSDVPRAVLPEFVGSAISSGPRLINQHLTVRDNAELDALVHFDGSRFGYGQVMMPALNGWMLFGAEAAARLSDTGSAELGLEVANAAINPHLSYADNEGLGYVVVRFGRDRIDAEIVSVDQPMTPAGPQGPPIRRRARFSVASWSSGEEPNLQFVGLDGEAPLLGLKT